jgi:RHS repeat-associated protein
VDGGYDGLNRLLWKANHSEGASPYASYSYDSTTGGNVGIGRLTSEAFASGPNQSLTGSDAYSYDVRGRTTGWTMSIGGSSYPFSLGYNDADQPTTLTYPDGDLLTTSYGSQGWLAGVTEKLGSNPTTTLLNSTGLVTAVSVNGTLSYLVQDTLGSVAAALASSGNVTANQLYLPYGSGRYASGSMPTSYGFTGQRSDPSGLLYFHARYYDPTAGQFISADPVQGPNRYGYVGGNPETQIDPTGYAGVSWTFWVQWYLAWVSFYISAGTPVEIQKISSEEPEITAVVYTFNPLDSMAKNADNEGASDIPTDDEQAIADGAYEYYLIAQYNDGTGTGDALILWRIAKNGETKGKATDEGNDIPTVKKASNKSKLEEDLENENELRASEENSEEAQEGAETPGDQLGADSSEPYQEQVQQVEQELAREQQGMSAEGEGEGDSDSITYSFNGGGDGIDAIAGGRADENLEEKDT